MILIRELYKSATYVTRSEVTARDRGELNDATLPIPSENEASPDPATSTDSPEEKNCQGEHEQKVAIHRESEEERNR